MINPQTFTGEGLDETTRELIQSNIDFWEDRGLRLIKQNEMNRDFDFKWVEHQKENKVLATLYTPKGYGPEDSKFDLRRITNYNEYLAFYNASARYMWQASLIGAIPTWFSDNEPLKHRVAEYLQEGRLFGFGTSEKDHGADLYKTESMAIQQEDGTYRLNGSKYYIGNANIGLISAFVKFNNDDNDFGLVLTDAYDPHFKQTKQIHSSYINTGYVGAYDYADYPFKEEDIIARGKEGFAAALKTVNVGKFQIGCSSSGICTHAFYECLNHSYDRWLYGARVTDMPHVRRFYVEAYLRTVGMRLFSYRNIDYFKSCTPEDQRFHLYNPVAKMKTPAEGGRIIDILWDAVTAYGFECETYMENATRDIKGSAKLEGTAHVNLSLILKFINSYLLEPADLPIIGYIEKEDDSNIFQDMQHGGLSKIKFADWRKSFELRGDLPNVKVLTKQAEALTKLFRECPPSKEKLNDKDYMLNLGMMFTMVPYAQLIIEGADLYEVDDATLNQILGLYVTDFGKYAIEQMYTYSNTKEIETILAEIISYKPAVNEDEYQSIWEENIVPLVGVYVQNK
ncbi:acyl-CoA dehydrogenase family protein [Fundicoccus culcitae]|uniref:Acyl-CoA dehydrogenase family protein n=1 Tax=Fundicoccus culcitae TaxID=2969821 RepID=A0ABY5P802_9LACT|nr:acyl-CoA dehydrogenase family protein [Fundicoccus culcitae]UUX34711.1 acyl-CoA dehydrogenase family protein [Fundicoccus culcitae]